MRFYAFDSFCGLPEEGWWQRTDKDYEEQKKRLCLRCSAALPMAEIPNNHLSRDLVSAGNLELLRARESPKVKAERIQVIAKEDAVAYLNTAPEVVPGVRGYLASHPDWRPSEFRTKVWHGPGEGTLTDKEVRALQRANDSTTLAAKGVENRKIAEIGTGPYAISSLTISEATREIDPVKLAGVSQIVGVEFESVPQLFASLDSCSGGGLSLREKDVVLKFINEEKATRSSRPS